MEALRLRVKDIDFGMKAVAVRSGKGDKDRVTTLSTSMIPLLKNHCATGKALHEADVKDMVKSTSRMPWREYIRRQAASGVGSTFFLPAISMSVLKYSPEMSRRVIPLFHDVRHESILPKRCAS
jgi:integrase